MKTALVLLSILSHFAFGAAARHDHPATHGMLLFGKEAVYLSHLPMFHSPHDYQVILKVELGAQAKQLYLEDSALHPDFYYTFVPNPFVLPEVVKNKTPFQGTLVRGHFEREGVTILETVSVKIAEVVYFKALSPQKPLGLSPSFLTFGQGKEQFQAHVISQAPDFDRILQISPMKKEIYMETQDLKN